MMPRPDWDASWPHRAGPGVTRRVSVAAWDSSGRRFGAHDAPTTTTPGTTGARPPARLASPFARSLSSLSEFVSR
ncbi:unnamed protein product [Lampetra planeri]